MEFLLLEASVALYSAAIFSVNHVHICGPERSGKLLAQMSVFFIADSLFSSHVLP